jgi:flagellar biogenesis protein FliO
VLVIVLLVALGWFIVRRMQRRKASQFSSQQMVECRRGG